MGAIPKNYGLAFSEIDGVSPTPEDGENNEIVHKAPPEENGVTNTNGTSSSSNNQNGCGMEEIPEKMRHQLKHRELFLSRQVETLPATHIRGKCCVTLLNETESLLTYLNKEDTFFYSLVYDPQQKTLLADKGEIRVGSKFQAETIPKVISGSEDTRNSEDLEELVWDPSHLLSEKEIDQFQIIARSVGTFARALDCTSTVRQPSLHMSAAAASRDVTIFHAMNTLHRQKYDIAKAIKSLVPAGGPVLCRDEMEEWSASEANLFEDAIEKYGKDFNDIRQDFLPWKSLKSIVEYYYMWKTTDRYVQQKRIKASEAESKLKQVYIPNYNKPNPAAITTKINGVEGSVSGRACESCYCAHSSQWYSWGPVHMQCRLCNLCWSYWKKYGGLKMPTRLDGERPPPNARQERIAQMNSVRLQKCTISGCGKRCHISSNCRNSGDESRNSGNDINSVKKSGKAQHQREHYRYQKERGTEKRVSVARIRNRSGSKGKRGDLDTANISTKEHTKSPSGDSDTLNKTTGNGSDIAQTTCFDMSDIKNQLKTLMGLIPAIMELKQAYECQGDDEDECSPSPSECGDTWPDEGNSTNPTTKDKP
ncbi:metastasis-associated protein MTA1 [Elysia marginata]|uniref:Metastasis-associated protein MTA1 n=1 Tax=Elysia marginata TaxID=1093978 RepID=A0AAV4GJH0_9GAST|nr:metastasis-associated protein MTA1 [Elysia marginata]